MRTLLEEHGGALATAAVIIIIIAAIVALGATGHLEALFTGLLEAFSEKARNAAGF
ncbi:MAG: hypothetical protein HFI37_00160 [Lachnospiraceae bacterium]|nr:hypothetical protein [Lachnospiraceae bacterium]